MTLPPPVAEFAAMVERVESALRWMPAGYTQAIRDREDDVESAYAAWRAGAIESSTVSKAIKQLELAWMTQVAKTRRTRAAAAPPQGASR